MNKHYIKYIKPWRIKNKERFLKYQREWSKKYREKNKEKIKEYKQELYKKMRKKLGYKIAPPGTGWETMRLKTLARDDCICRVCGGDGKEVHHLDGSGSNRKAKEMNNGLDNLITVCHRCHIKLDLIEQGNFGKGKWQEEIERNEEIIELSKKISQTQISKMYDITRQRVNQIIKKGKEV